MATWRVQLSAADISSHITLSVFMAFCCSTLCVHTCLYAFVWPCAPCVLLGMWVGAATAPSMAGYRLCTWNINRTDVIAISGENQGSDERRRGEIEIEVEVKEKKWEHVKGKKEGIWIQRWGWHKGEWKNKARGQTGSVCPWKHCYIYWLIFIK